MTANPCWRRLFWQRVRAAASRAYQTAGRMRPIRMPTMAMTTMTSSRVKAGRFAASGASADALAPLTAKRPRLSRRLAMHLLPLERLAREGVLQERAHAAVERVEVHGIALDPADVGASAATGVLPERIPGAGPRGRDAGRGDAVVGDPQPAIRVRPIARHVRPERREGVDDGRAMRHGLDLVAKRRQPVAQVRGVQAARHLEVTDHLQVALFRQNRL